MPNTYCGWAKANWWHGSCDVLEEAAASLHGWGCNFTVPATTVMSGVTLKTLLWNWDKALCCHISPFFLPLYSPWQLWPVPHIWSSKSNFFLLAMKSWVSSARFLHHIPFLPLMTLVQSSQVCLRLLLASPYQVLSFLHHYILPSTNNFRMQKEAAFSYSGKDLISSSVNCPCNVFLIKAHLPFSLWMSSNLFMGIFCFRLVPKFWKRQESLLPCVCLAWHVVLETSRGNKLITGGWTVT